MCSVCTKPSTKRCVCNAITYCSRKCQQQHWKSTHRAGCSHAAKQRLNKKIKNNIRQTTDTIYSALFNTTSWDVKVDDQEVDPNDTDDLFERRGLALSTLQQLSEASKCWPDLVRVLLRRTTPRKQRRHAETNITTAAAQDDNIESAIILETHGNNHHVQIRSYNENYVLQRSYCIVPFSAIIKTVQYTVGERVFCRRLDKRNYTRCENRNSSNEMMFEHFNQGDIPVLYPAIPSEVEENHCQSKGWTKAVKWSSKEVNRDGNYPNTRLSLATVVSFVCDNIDNNNNAKHKSISVQPLLVEHLNDPSVDANYTLPYLPKPLDLLCHGRLYDMIVLDRRFTTKDVCEELIKPLTRSCPQHSFVQMCAIHPTHKEWVGKAEAFISHAWKYGFAATIDAIDLWFETTRNERQKSESEGERESTSAKSCYLWFDIGTVAQHPAAQSKFPPNYFFNQFRKGIETIGCTVLVLMPFGRPLPLTRSWCVWEIYSTISDQHTLFDTALSRDDQRYRDTRSIIVSMEMKVENSTAWSIDDQRTIMDACQALDGGCQHVNDCVAEAFSYDQVRHHIRTCSRAGNTGSFANTFQLSGMSLRGLAVHCIVNHMQLLPLIDKDENDDKNANEDVDEDAAGGGRLSPSTSISTSYVGYRNPIDWFALLFVTLNEHCLNKIIQNMSCLQTNIKVFNLFLTEESMFTDNTFELLSKVLPQLTKLKSFSVRVYVEATNDHNYTGFENCLLSLLQLSKLNDASIECQKRSKNKNIIKKNKSNAKLLISSLATIKKFLVNVPKISSSSLVKLSLRDASSTRKMLDEMKIFAAENQWYNNEKMKKELKFLGSDENEHGNHNVVFTRVTCSGGI